MISNRFGLWLLGLLLFLCSPTCGYGQSVNVRPGMKAGTTFMTHGGKDSPSYLGYRTGLAGGVFVQVRVGSTWSIQPELSYVQKGARGTRRGITVTWRQHHLEIPILTTYRLPSIGKIHPTLAVGPFVDFNLDTEIQATSSDRTEVRNPANIQTTGFGLTFGVGSEIPVSFALLTLDVRYGLGLTNIEELKDDLVRNQGVILTLGLAL